MSDFSPERERERTIDAYLKKNTMKWRLDNTKSCAGINI